MEDKALSNKPYTAKVLDSKSVNKQDPVATKTLSKVLGEDAELENTSAAEEFISRNEFVSTVLCTVGGSERDGGIFGTVRLSDHFLIKHITLLGDFQGGYVMSSDSSPSNVSFVKIERVSSEDDAPPLQDQYYRGDFLTEQWHISDFTENYVTFISLSCGLEQIIYLDGRSASPPPVAAPAPEDEHPFTTCDLTKQNSQHKSFPTRFGEEVLVDILFDPNTGNAGVRMKHIPNDYEELYCVTPGSSTLNRQDGSSRQDVSVDTFLGRYLHDYNEVTFKKFLRDGINGLQ